MFLQSYMTRALLAVAFGGNLLMAADLSASECRLVALPSGPNVYACLPERDVARTIELVKRAIVGLGFPAPQGPRAGDDFFVGRYLIAWIDNTGYAGKLNGLWQLNGAAGDGWDFSITEPTPTGHRPINLLQPGENGDGRWARAYKGAEHYEMPRFIGGRMAAQAGIQEANHFAPGAPPWWVQCANADKDPSRWARSVGRSWVEQRADGAVVFRNEAPMRIVARFNDDAPPCGSPFLFDESHQGDLRLMTGYVFYPSERKFDRSYRFVNYSPYPLHTEGIAKVIGGLLLTNWPRPHYLKQYQRFIRWDDGVLERNSPFPWDGRGQDKDYIHVHPRGAVWLSSLGDGLWAGHALGLQQLASEAGEDFGLCLCKVHGGFELTGSVLAGQDIAAATDDVPAWGSEQVRTITLAASAAGEKPLTYSRNMMPRSAPGNVLELKQGATGQIAFYLTLGTQTDPDQPVVQIEFGVSAQPALVARTLRAVDFYQPLASQRFVLDFQIPYDGQFASRVQWLNVASGEVKGIFASYIVPDELVGLANLINRSETSLEYQ